MEEIKIICIAVALVWMWSEAMFVSNINDGVMGIAFDFKPFNCSFCMSVWVSIFLAIWFNEGIYLTIPIHFRLVNVIIKKI